MSTDETPRARRRLLLLALGALILLGAGFLRLVDLEHNPPGLWQDEASTGLDAYLIWTTGRDRAGELVPLIARSFGDYPLALYRYLDAPIVGLFGLSLRNERIVAAVFGTLLVLLTGLVMRRRADLPAAVAVMLVGALSPTWLHFSRYGSEAILLPAFLVLGWWLVEVGSAPGRRWGLWLGAVALGLSAYTYHAVKLFLPLWMAGFVVLQWPLIRRLWAGERRHLFGPALLFALLVLPSARLALTASGMARGQTVLAWYHFQGTQLIQAILSNYLSYFDPGMLFVRGGPAVAQSIPGLGMWNLIELPLMIAGLLTLFRAPERRRLAGFVLFWFLLGPLPGGVTYETHNMGRAIGWLPAPQIISALGLVVLFRAGIAAMKQPWAPGLRSFLVRAGGGALIVGLIAGWGATAWAVRRLTLEVYPNVTERDWQFEITRSMRCARRHRTAEEKLVVSPAFQLAPVFAQFFLTDLAEGHPPGSVYELAERMVVQPGEIYLFPAIRPTPQGRELCRVTHSRTGQVYAYVFGAPLEGPPAEEAPPPLEVIPPKTKVSGLRSQDARVPALLEEPPKPTRLPSGGLELSPEALKKAPLLRATPGMPPPPPPSP